MSQRSFTDELVRISDLATTTDILEDMEFVRCHVMGPAVLASVGPLVMDHSTLDGSVEAALIEVPTERWLLGVIGLKDVAFRHCRLSRIGFVGNEAFCLEFKYGFEDKA